MCDSMTCFVCVCAGIDSGSVLLALVMIYSELNTVGSFQGQVNHREPFLLRVQ